MAGASTDRTLYKSLLIFLQHWSKGNSNQEHYYVLIQKSYTEAKSCYINSIYKLLHWQVYVTEQHGRALLTSCKCVHSSFPKMLFYFPEIPSLRWQEQGTSHPLDTVHTRFSLGSSSLLSLLTGSHCGDLHSVTQCLSHMPFINQWGLRVSPVPTSQAKPSHSIIHQYF